MSRTARGTKGAGYDFWKRRLHFSGVCGYGTHVKRDTNRVARRVAGYRIAVQDYDGVEVLNFRNRGMTPT